MAIRLKFKFGTCAAASAALCALSALGQTSSQSLDAVTVAAKAAPVLDADRADVGGLGVPLARTPQSVTVLGADLLAATASSSLSQAIKLDASLADSYNTTGYIESLSVRGFLLDQGGNFVRNGLATSNYAPIALENKERIEVLKGVAGLQAGVSAPGGLVNYVTKVPLKSAFTAVTLGLSERGGEKVHLDVSRRWGDFGVRVNLAAEGLRPHFDHADGTRELASVAIEGAISQNTTLSAEFELHSKQQPSVPGVGLLDADGNGVGDTFPSRINPRLNLNNQTWSQAFESTVNSAQWALTHHLNADWEAKVAMGVQRSSINDRLAFPDGCSNSVNYVYPGLCANGDVDVYDYRSEEEERSVAAWDIRLGGKLQAIGFTHQLTLGLGGHSNRTDLAPKQAYNYVGSTNIDAPVVLPSDATANDLNTNTRERAIDAYASLVSDLSASVQSFAGLRISSLHRNSARSDGSRAVDVSQSVATPWAGLAWSLAPGAMVYASWGRGAEVESVPNRSNLFVNYGEVLPALQSEQIELGLKWQANRRMLVTAAAFGIDKPFADDVAQAGGAALRIAGGKAARHRGLEFSASGQIDTLWSLHASATLLDAKFTRAVDPVLVGQTVTNVPRVKATLFADYKVPLLPGFAVNALLTHESGKAVTSDSQVMLPATWQIDTGLRYQRVLAGLSTLWRLHLENLTDRVDWREAPTQYWGGIYLFPSTPRTLRGSVTVEF